MGVPQLPDLVCKISFVFPRLVFADGQFIFLLEFSTFGDLSFNVKP